jgi:hypothetical protein
MKSYSYYLLIFISIITYSCTSDLTSIGASIQPLADGILTKSDTIVLESENVFVPSMVQRQDSFLLGTFYDTKYGTTIADILAQVNCPVNFKYPPRSQPDSAKVVLYYKTWFGDSYSPLDVNIYEMNKGTFQYESSYPSNLNLADYCDQSVLLAHKIFTAKDAYKFRTDTTSISFKLSNDFVQRFYPDTTKAYYTSEADFTNNIFKGIYIKAKFGAATMLNIGSIDLQYFYHYTYNRFGKDTVVNNIIDFPANAEVRQVNRFMHPDTTLIKQQLIANPGVNYISSPAGIQTRILVPLKRMRDRMMTRINNKKLLMNSAIVKIEVTDIDSTALAVPTAKYMLLIKETTFNDGFFKNKKLPDDVTAILGTLTASLNSDTGLYEYYYSFNLAKLISNEIKIAKDKSEEPAESITFRLIPVSTAYSTNSSTGATTLTDVKQQYLLNAVTIKSSKNTKSPMRISLVYSGF